MNGLAVVLAAGQGSRMGGVAKALLDAGGESFLARVCAGARAAGLRPVVVTGGRFAEVVAAAARALGADVAENPAPERGMASSIATGIAAARPDEDGALIWPVDHPSVQPAAVAALLACATPAVVVVPQHAGRGGHPVWFGRAWFAALVDPALDARGGARSLLARDDPRVIRVNIADPGVSYDVDSPSDYAKMVT